MREEEGKTGRQGLGIEERDPRNQPLKSIDGSSTKGVSRKLQLRMKKRDVYVEMLVTRRGNQQDKITSMAQTSMFHGGGGKRR